MTSLAVVSFKSILEGVLCGVLAAKSADYRLPEAQIGPGPAKIQHVVSGCISSNYLSRKSSPTADMH